MESISGGAGDSPASVLPGCCSSKCTVGVSQGLSLACSAPADQRAQELNAHPLCISLEEEWEEQNDISEGSVVSEYITPPNLSKCAQCCATDSKPLLLQACTSHAIDTDSEECSCMPTDLAAEEARAACSPFLVIHSTPIGHGTFGTVFK